MTNSEIAKYYDSTMVEDTYDTQYSTKTCFAEDAMVGAIIRRLIDLNQGSKILDLGAGTGLLIDILNINPIDYTGIELSPKMVEKARKKHPNAQFIVDDMHNIPFPNNHFDNAFSLYGPLSYSLKPDKLLKEIIRVVKPGGSIALMPYTKRVGKGIFMGGYSTAMDKKIPKIFYSSQLLRDLFTPLENVEIYGINFFLNIVLSLTSSINIEPEMLNFFVRFLEMEKGFQQTIPAEFARHMIGIGKKNYD